jgi:tRNA (guanine26-N2/guanine27-N2)-dimethyltransferase
MFFSFPIETVKEGDTNIAIPKKGEIENKAPSKAPVFYNPLMKVNRDIAILVLQTHQRLIKRKLNIAEPLTGCGIRGIRFAKEVPGIQGVYINDINTKASKMSQYNIQINNLNSLVFVSNEDANFFLSRFAAPRKRLDYIDIDPFGTPVPFIDSTIRSIRNGGVIALTATDLTTLCGVFRKPAFRKYGGFSLRTEYCHEIAIRLLAGCLTRSAAKHKVGINILFSHSTDHYIRVYGLAFFGAKKADKSIEKMGYILHCFKCFHRETIKGIIPFFRVSCSECGSPLKASGPLWLGNLFNSKYCELMKETAFKKKFEKRIIKMLFLTIKEANMPSTYFVIDKICDKLGLPVPSLKNVITELRNRKFEVSPTHFHSRGLRTNAPAKKIKEIIKKLVT